MSYEEIEELEKRIAHLKEELSMIKKDIVGKELYKEMVAERKGEIKELERKLKDFKLGKIEEGEREGKAGEIEEERISRLIERYRGEIMKAASIYTRVSYEELAEFLECNQRDLIKIVDKMLISKMLFATIDSTYLIFDKGTKKTKVVSTQTKSPQKKPVPPGPPCPICSREGRYVTEYSRYFCDYCQKYI